MPKAPRHTTNQVGCAARRPAYQARSRARAIAPAPATASGPDSETATASGPAPAPDLAPVVVPAAPPAHRLMAAENTALTHTFGSRVTCIKMFFAVHAFITQPMFGAGPLIAERRGETAGIRLLPMMNEAIGCSPVLCLWELALVHDLQGYTSLGQYLSDCTVQVIPDRRRCRCGLGDTRDSASRDHHRLSAIRG